MIARGGRENRLEGLPHGKQRSVVDDNSAQIDFIP